VLGDDLIVGVLAATGQPHALARIVPDEPVPDRASEHDRGEAIALGDGGR
jgi:hypothetical protein